MNQATDEKPDTTIAKAGYRLRSKLASDELGDVYLAERTDPVQVVAFRVFRRALSADEAIAREVRRRAQLFAKVAKDHLNLAAVYECGETDDGRLFVATEHVDGESLAEIIRRSGPLEVGQSLRLAVHIAQGLEFIHNSAGAIHGDLRPENVVIADDGRTVKVRGFELAGARRAGRGDSSPPAAPAAPEYLAPEEIRGGPVAEHTDIYRFGLVVYEMLGGAPPFAASTGSQVAARQPDEAPASLRARRRQIPEPIERLVLQALEKAPERRPQNMTEVANALWTELSRLEEGRAKAKRQRLTWKAAASLSLLVIAASVWTGIRVKDRLTPAVMPQPMTLLPAPPVIIPTERDPSEPDRAGNGTIQAEARPTGTPGAPAVEPTVPQETERVPIRSPAPRVGTDRGQIPLTGPTLSRDKRPRERGTPADRNVRSGDPDPDRASARTGTKTWQRPETNAPDATEIIDWLLRQSSTAR